MLSLLASWLASTSVMPLLVGAAIGASGARVLRPCAGGPGRLAVWAAIAALAAHLLLVAGFGLDDGDMRDYAVVLVAAVGASVLACRRR